MSEKQVNARRNWKAQTFPYDYYIPDGSTECQYCLTDKQAEILRGIIEPLAWHTRWWSDTDTAIDQDKIEAFRDDLIRRLMMGCCGDEIPVQFRYTDDGALQRSTDGGTTWENAPEYDTRLYSPQFPPMSGDDGINKKCIAATGAVALIKEQVGDQLTDDMSRYTLVQVISDWVFTMLQTSNPFQALLTIAVNQIFALIIAVLRPALTEAVYDTLLCIFYCNMGDDASFTQGQVDSVTTDIGDQIGGVATLFLQQLVTLLGPVGMTNLARSGAALEGDCSECTECAEARVWFTNGIAGMTEVFPDELGVYTVTCNSFASGGYYGNIQFIADVIADGYNTCNAVNILTISGGDVSVKQECHTGANNYLSTCYALLQWTWTSPWTMTFTLNGDCS